ncbi:hypothetical protein O6H91_06G080700 [Diphasiastrum complanatum]|uniref:Uncharacterized protein n=1 Tax=Diphasiastrum complanatum TaxID=34168 RepID=A0ACC2DFN3_DIPCM|nr:hypothetical protein O6H91_06G080700 [Diphasiastrum complanatum]
MGVMAVASLTLNRLINACSPLRSSEFSTPCNLMLVKKNIPITALQQQSVTDADLGISRDKCLKGVKALVDEGIKKIPDAYVLPVHHRPCHSEIFFDSLPLIDMTDAQGERRPQFIEAIADACEKWGFFQVINHGVSPSMIQRMVDAAKEFFNLPLEEKMAYASDDVAKTRRTGATRVGTSFNPSKETTLQWRDHLRHPCTPCPDVIDNWPDNPTCYRQAALDYSVAIKQLAEQLLAGLSESLGLYDGSLIEKFYQHDQQLAVNYYPPCPNPDLAVGLCSHSDPGGITILFQDDVGGLQVLHEDRWIAVQPSADCLIINVGDQMEILTNGRYKSVEHRAVLNSERPRMSIISSYNPSRHTKISPIKHLVDEHHHPALYREISYADYLQYFYSKSLDGKSCIHYVKNNS